MIADVRHPVIVLLEVSFGGELLATALLFGWAPRQGLGVGLGPPQSDLWTPMDRSSGPSARPARRPGPARRGAVDVPGRPPASREWSVSPDA
jgi:hypothetical protein